jgi:hypothetical protein
MEALIGVIVGVVASVLVSRYYYIRSTKRSMSIYRLLDSSVFSGIAPDVRRDLHFSFADKDVEELRHMIFLVANTGDRAISNFIEPLTLLIPAHAEVLDAVIVHRESPSLTAKVLVGPRNPSGTQIALDFALLNKAEFFVVKLLLSGGSTLDSLTFKLLVDDLPRTLKVQPLPMEALGEKGYKLEWSLALVGAIVLVFPAWIGFSMFLLHESRGDLFTFPCSSGEACVQLGLLVLPGFLLFALTIMLGVLIILAAFFGGSFPPTRGPHFPLPPELAGSVLLHRPVPRIYDDVGTDYLTEVNNDPDAPIFRASPRWATDPPPATISLKALVTILVMASCIGLFAYLQAQYTALDRRTDSRQPPPISTLVTPDTTAAERR